MDEFEKLEEEVCTAILSLYLDRFFLHFEFGNKLFPSITRYLLKICQKLQWRRRTRFNPYQSPFLPVLLFSNVKEYW
jgi:hypothetical protein